MGLARVPSLDPRPFPSLPNPGDSSHSRGLITMSQQRETPPSFDLPSPFNSSNEPQPAGLSGSIASRPSLDRVFNFQIVVFQVSAVANLYMIKWSQHLSKRSRIRSFGFLGMASTFRAPLSRKFLHYGIHQRTVSKKAVTVLKIPSSCQELRRTIFAPSCTCYIHCAFWWYSQWSICIACLW